MTLSPGRARELVTSFPDRRILVVGDLMFDRYVYGEVSRISPEAPVPIVRVTRDDVAAGGASNAAVNIRDLGGQARLAGLVGEDAAGASLLDLLQHRGVDAEPVLSSHKVVTTVKTRVVAEHQQVVRVDRENLGAVDHDLVKAFTESAVEAMAGCDGVILEDYGKGGLPQPVVDALIQAAHARGIPIGYDPKDDHPLTVTGITMASPNRQEAFTLAGIPDAHRPDDPLADEPLNRAAGILYDRWKPDWLLVTLGSQGTLLVEDGEATAHVPTRAREVFDVSGAGDTVIATCLLALAGGATPREAAELANCAAAVVVGKLGTASCSPDDLLAEVEVE